MPAWNGLELAIDHRGREDGGKGGEGAKESEEEIRKIENAEEAMGDFPLEIID